MGELVSIDGYIGESVGSVLIQVSEKHVAEPFVGVIIITICKDGSSDLSHSYLKNSELVYELLHAQREVMER